MTARDAWTAAFLVAIFAPVVVRLFASERQSLGAVASVRTWARATRSIAGTVAGDGDEGRLLARTQPGEQIRFLDQRAPEDGLNRASFSIAAECRSGSRSRCPHGQPGGTAQSRR